LWYVIQTITTVGYGDVVPFTETGRLVGVIAMLSAIGISSLVTAAVTSSLMGKLRKEGDKLKEKSMDYVEKLERKLENLDSEMAKKEHIEDLKKDIKDIKSDINTLKEIIEKRDDF